MVLVTPSTTGPVSLHHWVQSLSEPTSLTGVTGPWAPEHCLGDTKERQKAKVHQFGSDSPKLADICCVPYSKALYQLPLHNISKERLEGPTHRAAEQLKCGSWVEGNVLSFY